jgi:hypothetical protein
MIQNLYVIVVVVIRLLAVGLIGSALYAFTGKTLISLIVGGGPGGVPWIPVIEAFVAGILLWLLAKPIAELVTTNV